MVALQFGDAWVRVDIEKKKIEVLGGKSGIIIHLPQGTPWCCQTISSS